MHHTALLPTLLLVTLPASVSAHGFVRGVTTNNGVWTAGSDPVWYYNPANRPATAGWDSLNQDNGFVQPSAFGTGDIACHKSATAGKAYVDVRAGDSLTFFWNTWPESHKGPIINYIAPCNGDCTTLTPTSLRWTKISQSGLISGSNPGTWITDQLIARNFSISTPIPRNLKPGNYVVRHEILALHSAQTDNGAQSYPQCLNLRVSGSGSVSPSGGVAGTGLYRRDEEGILFNLYRSFTSYPFPGPAVWMGGN